jgi:hypothetical protein
VTIAISMKVNDGIVLAADSASAIIEKNPSGALSVVNIYNNANKIFNLIKGKPVGLIAWGSGSIGNSSISTLTKDFRELIKEKKIGSIENNSYTIKKMALEFKKFIYDENYLKEFKSWDEKPDMGFMIVGYSTNSHFSEEWKLDIQNGECEDPYIVREKNQIGITWNGEPEAICRLYLGHSTALSDILEMTGLNNSKITEILDICQERLVAPMVTPAMPIQDAIELAEFLVDTTTQFSRFIPGASTVGGPTEIAAITKHEGFKWIKRKHYYDVSLNMGV